MANTFTPPVYVKAKPHASAEKQVGDSDPSARTDVVNRVPKGIWANFQRVVNALFDGITADGTDLTTVTAFGGVKFGLNGGHLFGLTLSNDAIDPTNDMDVAIGEAISDDAAFADRVLMKLTSPIVKQLDAAWAVGTNAGGRMSAAGIANTTYYGWLIQRPDTGVVDFGFDVSPTAPTMPTNYTKKRRTRIILREGGVIVPCIWIGDRVERKIPLAAYSVVNPGTNAVTAALLGIPVGISVEAIIGVLGRTGAGGGGYSLITALDTTDTAPTATENNFAVGFPSAEVSVEMDVRTDASAQIRLRASVSGVAVKFDLTAIGWIDRSGRDA